MSLPDPDEPQFGKDRTAEYLIDVGSDQLRFQLEDNRDRRAHTRQRTGLVSGTAVCVVLFIDFRDNPDSVVKIIHELLPWLGGGLLGYTTRAVAERRPPSKHKKL